jgi:hypothetical protein
MEVKHNRLDGWNLIELCMRHCIFRAPVDGPSRQKVLATQSSNSNNNNLPWPFTRRQPQNAWKPQQKQKWPAKPQPEEDTIAGFLDNHFGSMVCDPKKHRTCQLKARTLEHAMLPTPAIMHTPFPLASSTAS